MSYRALYRKYRPKLFSDIVGQPGIVQALTGQVAAGRISHAYLFSGPRGTGKTSAAKVLARAINCMDNHNGEACGVCKACVELMGDTNMDVIEIDAASNNSVDKIREMLENVKYMPAVGKYRVYIVDEVHMLSTSAFNALLKTLEEPPAHVVFILATTEPYKLPPTVLSRCQQFQFRRISTAAMTGLLEGVLKAEGAAADKEALQAIARASEGGLRDALSLLDQCLSLDGSVVTQSRVLEMLGTSDSGYFFSVAECVLSGDAGGAVDKLDQFINTGGEIKTFATDLCRYMRDLFIASYVRDASAILDVTGESAARLAAQAARFAPGDMLKCLGILSELEGSLRYAANPRVLVELALFRSCRVEKEASYTALLARVERLEARLESGIPLPAARAAAAPIVQEAPIAHAAPAAVAKPAYAAPAAAQPAVAAPKVIQEVSQDDDAPWLQDDTQPEPPESLFDDEPDDIFTPEPPQNLPGQMDRFAGEAIDEPAAAPAKPVPKAESHPASAAIQPGKLWHAVLIELEKMPQLLSFARKGKAMELLDGVLTVSFTEDDHTAVSMLEEEKRMAKLNAVVDGIAGSHVEIKLETSKWSPAQQQFIERSRAVIPKDATMIIEKEY
jgi:DNA polymerase III subunit gamma/tau